MNATAPAGKTRPAVGARRRAGTGRVAVVYDHLVPYTLGGAERYYWALARGFAADRPATYVTWRYGEQACEHRDAVEILGVARAHHGDRLVRDRMLPKVWFAIAILWHLLRHGDRYEVVHCACFPHLALVAASLGLLPHRRTKLIADWHEVIPREAWRRRLGPVGYLGYCAQRLAIPVGDAAITFSELHRERLRSHGRRGTVRVVPEFPPDGDVVPGRRMERRPLIVFAGRLVPEKRPHIVIQTLAELRRADPGWRAELFGTGPEEPRLRREIARLGLEGKARLAGFAPWSEVSEALAQARALVLPTTREGFGLIVLEAAAHGVPAVLVREPDNAATEFVEQNVNGLVCDSAAPAELASAVLKLVSDRRIHARTFECYRRQSKIYNLQNAVERLTELHRELDAAPAGQRIDHREGEASRAASARSPNNRVATASGAKRWANIRPAAPTIRARSRSRRKTAIASASCSGPADSSTRVPVSPSRTASGVPPTRVATTGTPAQLASRMAPLRASRP
jgi:glycosyltransferase involved in cell wall biosynthesis